MELILEINDAQKTRFVEGLAKMSNYQAQIQDPATGKLIDNPLTKEQFIKKWLIDSIREQLKRFEIQESANKAAEDLNKGYSELEIV
jgi:hypothetical protein